MHYGFSFCEESSQETCSASIRLIRGTRVLETEVLNALSAHMFFLFMISDNHEQQPVHI